MVAILLPGLLGFASWSWYAISNGGGLLLLPDRREGVVLYESSGQTVERTESLSWQGCRAILLFAEYTVMEGEPFLLESSGGEEIPRRAKRGSEADTRTGYRRAWYLIPRQWSGVHFAAPAGSVVRLICLPG